MPPAHAVAVYLGDDGLVHVEDGHAQTLALLHAPGIVVEGAAVAGVVFGVALDEGSGGEVVAGAEGAPGAAQDDGVDTVVVVRLPEGVVELLLDLDGEGVELLGTVEGDAGSSALDPRR